jgi:hypothetical protein
MPECAATIVPDSKLADVLERWPALEAVLLELSPHFHALRNPVLRRTVAKVATLRQVSVVSGVELGVLVTRLRTAAGLAPAPVAVDAAAAERPGWADDRHVTRIRDARAAIEAGDHPLAQVMSDLGELADGEVYVLVTPFVPAPLVDLARGKGYAGFSVAEGDAQVRTFFRRDVSTA